MRFHWYWPFARQEELAWANATARPGESIVVQVIDRPQAPEAGQHGPVMVKRDLADVDREVPPWRWAFSRGGTYLERAAARRSLWKSTTFDLVHLHYLNRFTDAVTRLPSPVVLSVHDVVPHRARLGQAEHLVLQRTYQRGDGLVVHHEALRTQLTEQFDIDPKRVHVVPHQVFLTPEVGPAPAGEHRVVLFFGALRANKGLSVLLEAAALLTDPDLRFVIAGRGDAEVEALARHAAERDARIRVEIGFASLERKRELFAEASLVVLPYTSFASQSGVLHDAYGHGRPVVVTDVGALGDSVREDGAGLVAIPGDADDLAARVLEALSDPVWSLLSLATLKVRAERSPERTGARLRAVYDKVLEEGGAVVR